jgi:cobalt/nickel transport system permease protein
LVAALLGPSAGVLVITCVLLVQCLMYADGGVLAQGANVWNMAIIDAPPAAGCCITTMRRALPGDRGRAVAGFCASWIAVVAGVGEVRSESWRCRERSRCASRFRR